MIFDGQEIKLTGTKFLVNIVLPEKLPSGLVNVQRDPRKQRLKPACYIGIVEEVGNRCQVKVGARVIVERWEWTQQNVDDERMIADERELMMMDDVTPAPGVMVMQLISKKEISSSLFVPETIRFEKPPYFHGEIIASSANPELGEIGEEVFVEAYETGQFGDDSGRFFFRTNKVALVLMRLKRDKKPELQLQVV